MTEKVALITGAARRIGAAITRYLHAHGMNVVIHHHSSEIAAKDLAADLNTIRPNSAIILKGELKADPLISLAQTAYAAWQRLDVLVNNASCFYATPLAELTDSQYQELLHTNLQSPLFLSQACAPYLKEQRGCIINITDIHAENPLKNHIAYCISKAGLSMLTKCLAKDLAPAIRVNAVAPGAVCWPEKQNALDAQRKEKITNETLLKRHGTAEDIAKAVWFFINDAPFVTGQTLRIDGGRYL